jgi:hypothetical protein
MRSHDDFLITGTLIRAIIWRIFAITTKVLTSYSMSIHSHRANTSPVVAADLSYGRNLYPALCTV